MTIGAAVLFITLLDYSAEVLLPFLGLVWHYFLDCIPADIASG